MRILPNGDIEIRNTVTGATKVIRESELQQYGIPQEVYLKQKEEQEKEQKKPTENYIQWLKNKITQLASKGMETAKSSAELFTKPYSPLSQVSPKQNVEGFLSGKRDLYQEINQLSDEVAKNPSQAKRMLENLALMQTRTGAMAFSGARDVPAGLVEAAKGTAKLEVGESPFLSKDVIGGYGKAGLGALQLAGAAFRTTPFGQATTLAENSFFETMKNIREGKPVTDLDFRGAAKDMFLSDALGIREGHPNASLALDILTNLALGKGEDKIAGAISNGGVAKAFSDAVSNVKSPKVFADKFTANLSNIITKSNINLPGFMRPGEEVGELGKVPSDLNAVKRSLGEGGGEIKERGFITHVKKATITPDALKDIVSGSYVVKSDAQLKLDASGLIKSSPDMAEKLALNPRNDVDVQIGNELIGHYASMGDVQSAKRISEGMAESGTELGRAIHAYSLYDKNTPQGALKFANSKIKEYNHLHPNTKLKITDKQVKSLFDRAHAIQSMPMGNERNIASNDLIEEINNMIPSSTVDKAITVWKAGLLTSLRTHERNLFGNTVHQVAEMTKDLPASVADMIMAIRTGKRSLTPTLKGVGRGTIKGLGAAKDVVFRGYDPQETITKFDIRHVTWNKNPFEQLLKKYTDSIFRTLAAADKPFWNAAFARSLYDQAGAEAINIGKRGNKDFINNLVKNATPEMERVAVLDANTATFKDKTALSSLASVVKKDLSKTELGKLVSEGLLPFTGVPSAVVGQMKAYSPIGLLQGIKKAGKVLIENVPELQRQAAQEVGRGTIGTGLFGLGAYLISQGLMTGIPKDADEARQWEMENKPNNSVFIGGKWRSINSVGPEALVLLAGAKFAADTGVGEKVAGVGKDIFSQTFLSGVQQPLLALADPARYGKRFVGGLATSLVPNIVKDVSKAIDPYQRETSTIKEQMKGAIPGLRNALTPRRDVLGNIIENPQFGPRAFVDLFGSKTPANNKIVTELGRLYDTGLAKIPTKLSNTQIISGKKMELTSQQLDYLESRVGIRLNKELSNLIDTDSYKNATDEERIKAINDTVDSVRTDVKKKINVESIPNVSYEKSEDRETGLGAIGKALLAEPGKTARALTLGQPIRKTEGGLVRMERQTNVGDYDLGDTETQIDHKLALVLGGMNEEKNLQILSNEEHAVKTQVDVYLDKQFKEGKITKKEMQSKDWREEIYNMPKDQKIKLLNRLAGDKSPFNIIMRNEYNTSIREMRVGDGYKNSNNSQKGKLNAAFTVDWINKQTQNMAEDQRRSFMSALDAEGLLTITVKKMLGIE